MLSSERGSHWPEQFAHERARVLAALGDIGAGGIVEDAQHLGATSVSGLLAWPCVDIGLSIWPFPIGPQHQAALAALRYAPVPGQAGAPAQRFSHPGGFQLLLLEAGGEAWADYRIISEYLRHNTDARGAYAAAKRAWAAQAGDQSAAYQAAKAEYYRTLLAAARAWWVKRQGFGPAEALARELHGIGCAWGISGGWALDLFLGQAQRVHLDVDVVIARADQLALRAHLAGRGWRLQTPLDGQLELWPAHTRLEPPRHQVHAHRDGAFIDVQLSEIECGVWHYRRDPAIIRSAERIWLSSAGAIPFLAPELVLLFKSQNTSGRERAKDQVDFERVYTQLDPERRAWLRWALLATAPAHAWIERLAAGGPALPS